MRVQMVPLKHGCVVTSRQAQPSRQPEFPACDSEHRKVCTTCKEDGQGRHRAHHRRKLDVRYVPSLTFLSLFFLYVFFWAFFLAFYLCVFASSVCFGGNGSADFEHVCMSPCVYCPHMQVVWVFFCGLSCSYCHVPLKMCVETAHGFWGFGPVVFRFGEP